MTETTTQQQDFHNRDAEAILDSAPWADVPEVATLPEQYWEFEIEDIGGQFTNPQDGREPKLLVALECKVLKPDDFAGRIHRESYFIGTNNDPKAQQPSTWLSGISNAATNLKKLQLLCETGPNWRLLKGKRFGTFTSNRDYEGRTYTQFQGFEHKYYRIGDGTFAPGTATPNLNTRRNRMPAQQGNGSAAPAADPNQLILCTVGCGRSFPAHEIVTHIQSCNGQPTPEQQS
jgi:hypothetical protein